MTSVNAARATPPATRSARSRPSTTPARRWPRPITRRLRVLDPGGRQSKIQVDPQTRRGPWHRVPALRGPRLPPAHRAGAPGLGRTCWPRTRSRTPSSCWPPGCSERSDLVGRNLMDHPSIYALGPGARRRRRRSAARCRPRASRTSAAARSAPQHAAFRVEIGNDGWRADRRARHARSPTRSPRGGCSAPSCAGTADDAVAPGPVLAERRAAAVARQQRRASIRATSTRSATHGR